MQTLGSRPRVPGIAPGRGNVLANGVLSGRAAGLARGRRSLVAVQASVQAPAAPSSSSSAATPAAPADSGAKEQPVPLTPAQLQLLQQHKGPLVKIATHYHVNFGDCLKVIGSSPEFGAWTAADAPLMKWGEGDVWSLVMPLPPGDYEFKVVVQQANGNLIWEAGDDNRLVSVPEDAPVDSMLVSVCAFNIIDGTTTPRLQPVTADVVALLEAQMEQEAAAEEEAAAAAAEAAAAEAEKGRALQAAAAVAKAIATMDAEAEEKRPRTMSDSDSEEDSSPAAPQRSRGGAPVVAAYATDAPPAQQQQQQPTSAKSNRAYQNEVDYYSAEAEAAVAKSSSKATPKPAAAAESTAATGVESAAPAVPIAADQALQANREDSEKKSDAEGAASSAASVRAKLAKDKPVAVGFVPPQRAPAAPPSSVVAAFMKSVGGKVQEPPTAHAADAAAPAATQPTEETAADDVPAAAAAAEATAAAQSAAASAAAAPNTAAAPAKGSSAPLPKGWGPDAGASKFPARDTNTAAGSDSSSAATTPAASSSASSGSSANRAAAAPSSFSSSLATPSAGTPPNSPSKQGQRPPSPGRGASHVVSAAAAAAVAAEWIQGVRNNEVMSAAREAEKAASELSARLQQARQRKSEAAAEADRLNETLKHSSLVKGVKDVAPADSSSSGGGEAAAASAAAAPAAPSVNGWMAAPRSKIGMTDAGAPPAANSSSTPLSPPPITPVSGGSATFAAASAALSATASVAVAGADMGPSPPPVIHAPGGAATAKRPAVSTQAVSAGGAALAAASGAAAYGSSTAGAGAGGGALEGDGSAGGEADAAGADAGMKFLASVVGCAAVGTVMWSEFVLKETGCGLPPGPYGLLGAAEGLSYLAVLGFAGAGAGARYKSGGKQGLPGPLAVPETLAYGALGAGLIVLASQLYTYGYIPPALPGDQCYADAAVAMPGAAELNMQLAALKVHVDDFSDYVGTQAAVLDAAWQLGLLELQDSLLNTTDAVSAFVDTHLQQLDLSGKLGHVLEILRAQEQQLKVELPQQLAELQQLAATSMAVVQETALHASSTAHLPELLSSLDHVMATLHGVLETRIQQLDVVLTQLQSSIGAAAGQLSAAVAAAQQSGSTEAAAQLQGLQALLGDAMTDVQAQVWAGYQQLALADKLSDMLLTVRTSAAAVATSTATEMDKLRLQEQLQQLEGLAESSAGALAANAMDALHHMQLEERLQDIANQASAAASSLQAGLQQQYKSQLPVVQAQLESLQAGIAQMSHKAQQQQVVGGPGGQELESLLKDLQVSMDSTMKLVGDVASSGVTAAGDAMQNAGDAASSSLAAVSEQLGAATDAVSSSLASVSSTTSSSVVPAAADVASPVASVLPNTARVATQTASPVSSVLQQSARVAAHGLPAPIVTEAATTTPGAFIVDTAAISAAREAAAAGATASGVPPESLAAAFGEAVESGMDFSSLVAYSLPEHRHILEALPTEQTFSVSSGVNLKDASDVMRSIWWHRPQ